MTIKGNTHYAVTSTDVCDINNKEMRQMFELKNRIATILDSHENDEVKNEYATDEDLKLMWCILHTMTAKYASTQTSAFDNASEQWKERKNATEQKKVEDVLGIPF